MTKYKNERVDEIMHVFIAKHFPNSDHITHWKQERNVTFYNTRIFSLTKLSDVY